MWRPNTAKNPTKSCPKALAIFATCSWPSLCEQSELQCWRRNKRLCGPAQIYLERPTSLAYFLTTPYLQVAHRNFIQTKHEASNIHRISLYPRNLFRLRKSRHPLAAPRPLCRHRLFGAAPKTPNAPNVPNAHQPLRGLRFAAPPRQHGRVWFSRPLPECRPLWRRG